MIEVPLWIFVLICIATYINFVSYYIVGIPLAYALAFGKIDLGFLHVVKGQRGLWCGVLVGMSIHLICYVMVVYGFGSGKRWQGAIDRAY